MKKLKDTHPIDAALALQESEERFRKIFREMPVMMAITRMEDGKFLDVNERFLETTGYTREELMGKSTLEIGWWAEPADRTKIVTMLAEGKPIRDVEVQYRSKKHGQRTALFSTEEIIIEGVQCLLSATLDINDQLESTKALEAREKLFRALIESSSDGIHMLDRDGKVLFISQSGARIVGYNVQDLLFKDWWSIIHGDDRNFVESSFKTLLDSPEKPIHIQFRALHSDGGYRWIENVSKNFLADPEIGAIISNFRDVTERNRVEAERQVLFEINQAVNVTDDLEEMLDVIHQSLKKIVYAENIFIALYEKHTGLFHKAFLVDQYDTSFPPARLEKSLTAYTFRKGKAMIIDQAAFNKLVEEGEVELVGTNSPSWLGVPLKTTSEPIGVLVVQHYVDENAYEQRDLEFLDYVGGQIAMAIDRKRAEENLGKSLSLLTATLESTNDGILVVNKEGRIVSFNRKLIEMWRVPEEIMEARDDAKAIESVMNQLKSPEVFVDKVRELYAKPNDSSFDILEFKDGRIFERYSKPQEVGGESVGRVWSFRDITQRKRSEELQNAVYHIAEAAGNSATLEELFKAVHGIIQNIMSADNFYIALFHEREKELQFPYFVDTTDSIPSSGSTGKGLTSYVLRKGTSLLATAADQEALAKKGETEIVGSLSAVWLGVPLVVDKKTIGVMTVQHYTDPTVYTEHEKQALEYISAQVARAIERKRADEQIRQLAYAIENVRDAIFRLSAEGIIVSLNAAFSVITGWETEEWIGRSFTSIIHPADLPLSVDMFERAMRGEEPPTYEIRILKKSGEFVVAEITTIPLLQDGKAIGVLGDARDITERKKLEEHLRQSQKMESIGILAGGIAHDFNNILTIILAYASTLQHGNLTPEKYAQSIDAIKKTSYRGAELVQQILTFARKKDVSHESVNVNLLIDELVKLLNETFPKTVTIDKNLDPAVPTMVGDSNQIHQALLSLAVNARDAMPNGGMITFTTETVQRSTVQEQFADAEMERYVRIRVGDTGSGITETDRVHIFEPFFTTKERGRGTGLGLAVVYGIIKSHNGHINFTSQLNEGTTFDLYFPVAETKAAKPEPVSGHRDHVPGGTETILFVEDEEMLLDLLHGLFASKGYNVLTARDGMEAVEVYKKHRDEISIVLSDMGLPRMGGYEAFQAMKVVNPAVKVILASGYLDPKLKSKMIEEGAKDFIQKPYEPDEILKKIHEVIRID